jgi:hypothetical protein
MKTGTKSVLFGVHQFIWHPITVWLAWWKLYGKTPTFKETICIVVHDWGYWGCSKMDDAKGEEHPMVGASVARFLFGDKYGYLVLCHSRHLSNRMGLDPSELCWPDKFSILYEPRWWYLLRANLSGEIKEYVSNGERYHGRKMTQREWFDWIKAHLQKVAKQRIGAEQSSSRLMNDKGQLYKV